MINPARTAQSAFTLIELLIVIAIVGILAAASIPVFSSFTNSQRLSQAAKQVKQDLRSVQNRAINGVEGKAWGIEFVVGGSPASYTPFKCALNIDSGTGTCSCATGTRVNLPSKSLTSGTTFTAAETTVFDEVNGDVCASWSLLSSGSSTITLTLDGTPRAITVSAGGQITEE